ncbi:osteopetrosis-associated transmembrane protein 1-like [Actinia tenebrosa]|uniref:Osteopetrosis-associated transmembrane protein 1-like n=1 Tax=Actinia tenebrosa TaxID=6105 RepID=A0A6P8H9J4_ACTTE|nr:osteopetrosis-associated transmembrane protein 1-like [Actinia tenebrosa]
MLITYLTVGILSFFALNSAFVSSKHDIIDKNCKKQLEGLAESISNFTRCAVSQASPFKFCRMCYEQYDDVRRNKNEIYKKGGCVSELVESERYQIVSHACEFAKRLWEESNCFSCFSSDHKNEDSIGTKWEIDPKVKDFFNKQQILYDCFKNFTTIPVNPAANTSSANTTSICKFCKPNYEDLNDVYKDLINQVGGYPKENLLCADVMSAMNSTRHKWSSTFGCIKINYDTASVVALTCLFAFLPVIFYSAAKLRGDEVDKKSSYNVIPQISYDAE